MRIRSTQPTSGVTANESRILWRSNMKSKKLTATLRVFGWMAFYLLLSAPAIILPAPTMATAL